MTTRAAEPPATLDPEPWRFTIALYAWAIGVTGNVTARNQTIDTNASSIDLVQKSDSLVGLMAYFEADKGRSASIPTSCSPSWASAPARPTTATRSPGCSITTRANAALTYQLFIVEMGGVYELFRWPGSTQGTSTALDGMLGFRYWNNSIAASFDATTPMSISPASASSAALSASPWRAPMPSNGSTR